MKNLISALILLSFGQAFGLTLKSGENAQINGTEVTCEAANAKRNCSFDHDLMLCKEDAVIVIVNGTRMGGCMSIEYGIETMRNLKSAGICN